MKRSAIFASKKSIAFALITVLGVSATTAVAQDMPVFNITLKNGVVSPKMTEVPIGKHVKIIVSNDGDATAEFESKPLHIEKIVAAGTKTELTLRGLSAGSYEFVDEYTEDLETAHGFIIAK